MSDADPDQRIRQLFALGKSVSVEFGVQIRRYYRSCQELMRMVFKNIFSGKQIYFLLIFSNNNIKNTY